ncbi:2-methylene-furan-3-one reductase [Yarrowia sp. C11]|nr:2-methylene-furan-3-one reductase [Yarrowia sp. C11]KAG5364731.1 2-methylene-furan-3-one reductase [Yarrowia sp. E02]
MKAAYTTGYGGPEKIKFSEDHPKTTLLSDDHVIIKVAAAALNPIDGMRNRGFLKMLAADKHPHIFGYDVSGIVEEVGPEVTEFKAGDRVYSRIGERQDGTMAEFVSVKASLVARAPSNVSLQDAAGIPLVGLTTMQAFEAGNLQKDQTIFISKGSGGIGTFAIQLAKNVYGAKVITTASEKKIDLLKQLGADQVINYKTTVFKNVVKDVDFALDVSNQPHAHVSITKKNGFVGTLNGTPSPETVEDTLGVKPGVLISSVIRSVAFVSSRCAWIYGVRFEPIVCRPSGKQLEIITEYIEAGKIKPVTDCVFDLKDAAEAVRKLEKGHATGKIIVSVDPELR